MKQTRRAFMTAGAALAGAAAAERAFAEWKPSERYPDPAIQALDPSFGKYRLGLAGVERLATGMRWCEGPAWFGDGRYLVWSDIPNNIQYRWLEEDGHVSVFRNPSGNSMARRSRWGSAISAAVAGIRRIELDLVRQAAHQAPTEA